ncbi:MAG TPA: homocysteine S-methyltransferase family protein [Myxococcota bacterium]|nr:homocysteine S-methyltransferase family protein [Myxococcota bacterium]
MARDLRTPPAAGGFEERLRAGPPILLDGALGTELERRGCACALPLWSAEALLSAPALVEAIHAEYVAAGCEVLTANTFRTQRRTLAKAALGERAEELSRLAVALARRAGSGAGRRVFVAGSAAPLEDCWHPERVPPEAELAREHAEHAAGLAAAGVDLVLVETMGTKREARAALAAARAAGLAACVSFTCGPGARLLSGEPLARALDELAPLGPCAVLVNCLPPRDVDACLPVLRSMGLPFGVKPNLGAPGDGPGAPRHDACAPDAYGALAVGWITAGARLVGGCCGTTPAHLRAVAERLRA